VVLVNHLCDELVLGSTYSGAGYVASCDFADGPDPAISEVLAVGMAKAKLRVGRLTLAPRSDLLDGRDDEDSNDDEENQAMRRLDCERFARAIELSMAVGEGNRKGFHRHGKELEFTSKFWAKDDGGFRIRGRRTSHGVKGGGHRDTNLSEALNAGFLLEQIKLAEVKLDSPQ
jgi:hypothetical protein